MPPNMGDVHVRLTADTAQFSAAIVAAQQKMSAVGAAFTSVGARISAGLSLPTALAGRSILKSAIAFESAFTGVRKTVEATEPEFNTLRQGILDLSSEIPLAATEIAGVAEAAGQLGIATENVLGFTKVMADLGVTTNLTSKDAAIAFARMANITQLPQDQFDRLGSSLVALGNTTATTEADITQMALRIAKVGAQVGLSNDQILGYAAALSSVGIEAEAGGTAIGKVFTALAKASAQGGNDLKEFSRVAGTSAKDFQEAFQRDAAGATLQFIEGLDRLKKSGEDVFTVLEDVGLSEVRVQQALLGAAGAGQKFRESLALSSKAWQENIALLREAELRYGTTESLLKIFRNELTQIAVMFGDTLLPVTRKFVELTSGMTKRLRGMDAATRNLVLALGAVSIAIGPVIAAFGILIRFVSPLGLMVAAVGLLGGAALMLAANWEDAGPKILTVVEEIGKTIERNFRDFIGPDYQDELDAVIAGFQRVGQEASGAFQEAWRGDWEALGARYGRIMDDMGIVTSHFLEELDALLPGSRSVLEQLGAMWGTWFQLIGRGLAKVVMEASGALLELSRLDWEALGLRLQRNIQEAAEVMDAVLTMIDEKIPGTRSLIESIGESWERQKVRIEQAIPSFESIKKEWDTFKTKIQLVMLDVKLAIEGVKNEWELFVDKVKNRISEFEPHFNKLRILYTDLHNLIVPFYKDITKAIEDNLKAAARWADAFALDLLGNEWDAFKTRVTNVLIDIENAIFKVGKEWDGFVARVKSLGGKAAAFFGFGTDETLNEGIRETERELQKLSSTTDQLAKTAGRLKTLGGLDVFGRGAKFPGEQLNPKERFPSRNATEFEKSLERITVNLQGIHDLQKIIEQFNPNTLDIQTISNTKQMGQLMADWRDLQVAVSRIWQEMGTDLDAETQRALNSMLERFFKFSDVLYGNSIIPDLAKGIEQVWKQGMMGMEKQTKSSTDAIQKEFADFQAAIQPFKTDPFAGTTIIDSSRRMIRELGKVGEEAKEKFSLFAIAFDTIAESSLNEELKGSLLSLLKSFESFFAGADKLKEFASLESVKSAIKSLSEDLDLTAARIKALDTIWKDYVEAMGLVNAKTQSLGDRYDALPDMIQAVEDALVELNVSLQQQGGFEALDPANAEEFRRAIANLKSELATLQDVEAIRDAFDGLGSTLNSSIGQMVQGVLRGTQTMEEAFDNMVQNILISLASNALQNAITGIFTGLGSFVGQQLGGSGVGELLSGVFGSGIGTKRKGGGNLSQGQAAIVGERGPEVYVPHSAGRVIPNHMLTGNTGPQVEVNVINQSAATRTEVRESREGARRRVEVLVVDALQRDLAVGGKASQAFAQTFGLARTGGSR